MHKVVVTGMGMVSAVGDKPDALFKALVDGGSSDHERLHGPVAGIPRFDPVIYLGEQNFRPLDRLGRLSVVAARLALDSAGWTPELREQHDVGLVFGALFSGLETVTAFDDRIVNMGPKYSKPMDFANTVLNAAAGQTALWHNLRGINSTVAGGSASGLQAVIQAVDFIRSGLADALLAGGAEELCDASINAWQKLGLAINDPEDDGFRPGEGAAFLMLESEDRARKRDATILAEISGVSSGFDPLSGSDEDLAIQVISQTLQKALEDAGASPDELDCASISANGTKQRDALEKEALNRFFGERPPSIVSKAALGETLGAGGAFQLIALLEAMRQDLIPTETGEIIETTVNCGLACALALDGPVASVVVRA